MVNIGELEVGIGNRGQRCQVVVLGCSMARRKSRASIELGVQGINYNGGSVDSLSLFITKMSFWRVTSRLTLDVNRFVFAQEPKLAILNLFQDRKRSGLSEGPRGSTTDGSPVIVLDRSGMTIITDRVSSS
ncbi:hypothetical protein PIB30_047518 [Stylosanthes scabra]|uniref:Uncharacterized protein n=1 Tax=Stylosanthes scabra TaxID=79078 RepID=A0ABU6XH04_9FABA|nr:hypothetical protein [Stylosanthes scabra]